MRRLIVAAAVFLVTSACSFDSAGPGADRERVSIASAIIADNPHNALSALVSFKTQNADSARVIYRTASSDSRLDPRPDRTSPFFPVRGDSGTVAVLGLRENTSYDVILQVIGGSVDTVTAMSYRAGPLPSSLAGLRLVPTGNQGTGYTLTDFTTASAAYIVIFDETGVPCWYREFAAENYPETLAQHYIAYRAHVRAKVACLRASQTVRLVRTVRSSRADRAGARASSSAMSPALSLSSRPCRARQKVTMA